AGHVMAATVALQAGLGAATVYLVYALALRLARGRRRPALAAALLCAAEPLAVIYAAKLLTETAFTFLLVVGLWALAAYLGEGRGRHLALAGLCLVGAAYVRPVAYYLPALVALGLTGRALRRRPRRGALLAHAAAFAVSCMVGLGAWRVRNAVVAGYDGFSAIADVNLYYYQAAAVRAAREGIPFYTVQEQLGYRDEEIYLAAHPEQRDWPPARRYAFLRRAALEELAAHPLAAATLQARGVVAALADPGGLELLRLFGRYPRAAALLGVAVDRGLWPALQVLDRERPGALLLNLAMAAALLAYYGLAALGLARGRPPGAVALLLVGVGLYLLLLSGGPASLSRFRHPLMPLVCALAGLGWEVASRAWAGGGRIDLEPGKESTA
ncbi:MAG: glycosyltransferase family 39 protein, partial [Gemmatimonadota bacterium]